MCADGGANRALRALQCAVIAAPWQPSAIIGDLDSIRATTRKHWEAQGVPVLHDADQNSTDLTKCLMHLSAKAPEILSRAPESQDRGALDVIILGSTGGRLDQAFSALNSLVASAGTWRHGSVTLLDPSNVVFCLCPGRNVIHTPREGGVLGVNVGVIPLGGPASISTHGLEYDVQHWPSRFGGQVSTSNHIVAPVVEIDTHGTEGVLFTVELVSDAGASW